MCICIITRFLYSIINLFFKDLPALLHTKDMHFCHLLVRCASQCPEILKVPILLSKKKTNRNFWNTFHELSSIQLEECTLHVYYDFLRHNCLPGIKQWKQPSQLVNELFWVRSAPAPFTSENKEALKACQPLSLKYLDSLHEFMKKNVNSFVYPTPNHINNGMASDQANHPAFYLTSTTCWSFP